jgi:hypothetical protein
MGYYALHHWRSTSMNLDPYRPPEALDAAEAAAPTNRRLFVLAAIGAGLASVYWAALTLLLGFGAASGSTTGAQVILPCVLVVLYAVRGFKIFKGDRKAARGILWLHGLGALMAILRVLAGNPITVVLQAVKIAIHVFGGVTAYLAQRAPEDGNERG